MDPASLLALPDPGSFSGSYRLEDVDGGLAALDAAEMILWGSFCGVHTVFKPEMVEHWKRDGRTVLVRAVGVRRWGGTLVAKGYGY